MAWTLCTSGQAVARAGSNFNTAAIAAYGDLISTEIEGWIEAETGMSIVSNFAGYSLSGAASMAAAAKIAQAYIAYDTTGYLAREADILMNENDADYKACIKNIKEFNKTELQNPN